MTEPVGNEGMETREVELYSVFDGVHGRSKGIYLDIEERKHDEVRRAMVEDREPEFALADLPGGAGTPLVTEENQVDNRYYSNPSVVVTHEDGRMPLEVVTTTELVVDETPTVQNASPELRAQEDLGALDTTNSKPADVSAEQSGNTEFEV